MIVLDASAALARLLPSQSTPASLAFFSTELPHLIAPAIFEFEARNALLRAERRGFAYPDVVDEASEQLALMVELQPWATGNTARLLNLARREILSLFDAAYLDLARVEGAALASRDGPLLAAAARLGVPTHDLR